MNILGIIISVIFTLIMIAMNISMAIQAIQFLFSLVFSNIGVIILQIAMLIIAVYFISKKIQEDGTINTLKDIFISSDDLCVAFWVYFFSLRTTIDNMIYYAVKVEHAFSTTGAVINIFLIYAIGISTIITAIRSKSFVLWKGLAITVISILLGITSLGLYIVKKENMILGDFWYTDSNDASDNSSNLKNDKIDAWRKIVDNLLG